MTQLPPSGQPGPLRDGEFIPSSFKPITKLITSDVPAPAHMYVTDDQFLRITCQNVAGGGVVLRVTTRLLRAIDGVVVTGVFDFTPTFTGALNVFTMPLSEGFLLSCTITTATPTVILRGLVFVSVTMCTGSGSDVHLENVILQDYLTGNYAVCWPTTPLRSPAEGQGNVALTLSAAPAAGAEIAGASAITIPLNTRVRLESVDFRFTTSAVVANRVPQIILSNFLGEIYQVCIPGVIAASQATRIVLAPGAGSPSANNNHFLLPLPNPCWLLGGSTITTSTTALQAGDQYDIISWYGETYIAA